MDADGQADIEEEAGEEEDYFEPLRCGLSISLTG